MTMDDIYSQTIKLFGSHPEPAFESAEQQVNVWGRRWGCDNDVGRLRVVLMHRPGDEMKIIDPSKRIEEIGSYGDLEAGWYFQSDTIPALAEMQAQHDGLVRTLRDEGVEVVFLDAIEPDGIKSVYTRDSSFAVKGGAIVTRLARKIRRGEEAHVTRTLANLGMPILRTLHGTAMAEGGSFAWLNSKTAVIGLSSRVNEEGARQIEEVLRSQGVELIRVTLTGYRLHIDGVFLMVAPDLALINPTQLPFWFLAKLQELKIHAIEVHHQDNPWIINSLAVAPGRVLMAEGASDHTLERLRRHQVSVVTVPYDKVCLGGGGLHCSTAPLIRDPV